MIKIFKSNKFIVLTLFIMCIILLFNPLVYANTCLNAISVWAVKVLPLLFPFFILTKLIVNLSTPKENFMDKFFNKVYHTPAGSFSTFILSVLSGYPMGAKLICEQYENRHINSKQAEKMLSFCSVSGPMFMLGTVGLAMLNSYKIGLIILFSNILASLLNGLIYRGRKNNELKKDCQIKLNKKSLSDIVYDSLISILMVGSFIVLSFLLIEILNNLKIFTFVSDIICGVFKIKQHQDVVLAIMSGLIEITRGISDLAVCSVSLKIKGLIASSLIGFGGLSILLQSMSFLNKLNLSTKTMLKQKFTQGVLCLIISTLLCLIIL